MACKSWSLVGVASFLPGRAKDLLAPRYVCMYVRMHMLHGYVCVVIHALCVCFVWCVCYTFVYVVCIYILFGAYGIHLCMLCVYESVYVCFFNVLCSWPLCC